MTNALARMLSIAEAAASVARKATPAHIDEKAAQDYVTDVDRQLQQEITRSLQQYFPGTPALGEEGISAEQSLPDRAFLIDPLDGTGNWIAGLPFSAVSVAYLEDGITVMAAVVGIAGAGAFAAEQGKGAWRDGQRMQVPDRPAPLIGVSTGVLDSIGREDYRALREIGKIRNLGSQALQLCLVGCGALSLDASLEARLWDDAAGRLIATEAGGCYTAAVNPEQKLLPAAMQRSLCAHPRIFQEASGILSSILSTQPTK